MRIFLFTLRTHILWVDSFITFPFRYVLPLWQNGDLTTKYLSGVHEYTCRSVINWVLWQLFYSFLILWRMVTSLGSGWTPCSLRGRASKSASSTSWHGSVNLDGSGVMSWGARRRSHSAHKPPHVRNPSISESFQPIMSWMYLTCSLFNGRPITSPRAVTTF
jgi:hypothetical protein